MKQINLKADSQNKIGAPGGNVSSLILGVLALALSLGTYGVIYYYNDQAKKEIASLKTQKEARQARFANQDFQKMYFFQDRLGELKLKLQDRIDYMALIADLTAHSLPETTYEGVDIKAEDSKLNLELVIIVPNIEILNKQLKVYTLMKGVTDFLPGPIGTEEKEAIEGIRNVVKFSLPLGGDSTEKNTKQVK